MRLVHTADVHLGGGAEGAAAPRAFAGVIDLAIGEAADVLLIVGDLFDDNRPKSHVVDHAVTQINRFPGPVVLLPGNHDCLDTGSVYHKVDFEAACPNLTLLADPAGTHHALPDLGIRFWGRPVVEHAPEFRPLGDAPARPDGDGWHVVLGHGLVVAEGEETYRSSPIRPSEIAATGADYVALGHVHPARDVSTTDVQAFYSGSPVTWGNLSDTFGFVLLVDFDPVAGVSVTRRPVAELAAAR
ncbi:MAG TPA: DNA repair exonuclease [Dehalococcoidia bacterium]|nr:DNA repair exonuclease [Dehalococcoidia bacterium]